LGPSDAAAPAPVIPQRVQTTTGLSAAASFHSIRNHIGLSAAAVVLAALGAAVAVASAVTDRR